MKVLITLMFLTVFYICGAGQINNNSPEKPECEFQRNSKIELRIGFQDRLYERFQIPETLPQIGFNPSIQLTLPAKIKDFRFFYKLNIGKSIYNVHFNDLSLSSGGKGIGSVSTDLYANINVGIGLGSAIVKKIRKNSSLRIPISLNVIYLPYVETFSEDGFMPISFRDYLVDIENNLSDKRNLSIVPEIAIEYHFLSANCYSYSIGVFYSRGLGGAYEGSISIQRSNGDLVNENYSKPFSSFGFCIGYSIFRSKVNKI